MATSLFSAISLNFLAWISVTIYNIKRIYIILQLLIGKAKLKVFLVSKTYILQSFLWLVAFKIIICFYYLKI